MSDPCSDGAMPGSGPPLLPAAPAVATGSPKGRCGNLPIHACLLARTHICYPVIPPRQLMGTWERERGGWAWKPRKGPAGPGASQGPVQVSPACGLEMESQP